MNDEKQSTINPRRERILEGALKTFLTYGFSRTTMDDIAHSAGLSRSALYQLFRNKTDIYRVIAACVLERSLDRAEAALASEGGFIERLDRLVQIALYDLMKDIEEAPHGPEILDMRNSLAGDIVAEWRNRIDSLVEKAIVEETIRTDVDLAERGFEARTLAETLLDALEGMKPRISSPASHLATARTLVRIIAAALRP